MENGLLDSWSLSPNWYTKPMTSDAKRTAMEHTCSMILQHSLVAQRLKRLPATWEIWVRSLGWEDPLEKEMAIHFSILAWRIPWRRSLVGYSPWGHKELDTTEQLHFHKLTLVWLSLIIKNEHITVCIFCLSIIYFGASLFMTLALFILAISKKISICIYFKVI